METVEQISIPLAIERVQLVEGGEVLIERVQLVKEVLVEWKEANIRPLFKKGSRNKSDNYIQTSAFNSNDL